jgi:hypothetical protein
MKRQKEAATPPRATPAPVVTATPRVTSAAAATPAQLPASAAAAPPPPPVTPVAVVPPPIPVVQTTAEPPRRGSGRLVGGLLLGAAGLLAAGGGVMLASSRSEFNRGRRLGCPAHHECPAIASRVDARALWAKVLFGAAAAGGIAGGTVLVLSFSKDSATAGTGLTVALEGKF